MNEYFGGLPGIGTARTATPRRVLKSEQGAIWMPNRVVIDASKSRDPGNTGDVHTLRAGILLGKITSGGKYAPSIIGLTSEALDGDETELDVPAGVDTEIVRRIGASGTFYMIGPPTAAGTVRKLQITYSAVNTTTHKVTITAPGVAEVQTLTLTAGTDGGSFRVKYGSAVSAVLAWNVAAADLQTALRALHADLAACTVGLVGEVYTVTFPQKGATAGPKSMLEVVTDFTADSGVYEGGITVARTATGVNGDFVTSSIIAPEDGSEDPKTILEDGYGLKVTDEDGVNQNQPLAKLLIGGIVDATQIINYPADASLKAWIKTQLRTYGPSWSFDDEY